MKIIQNNEAGVTVVDLMISVAMIGLIGAFTFGAFGMVRAQVAEKEASVEQVSINQWDEHFGG